MGCRNGIRDIRWARPGRVPVGPLDDQPVLGAHDVEPSDVAAADRVVDENGTPVHGGRLHGFAQDLHDAAVNRTGIAVIGDRWLDHTLVRHRARRRSWRPRGRRDRRTGRKPMRVRP